MIRRVTLSNGLRLLVREMRSAPAVALNLWVGSGSSDDPEKLSGISHFIEHMLFKGSGGESRVDVAQEVHASGGYLNAETGCDHTMYYQVVPSGRWREVLRASVEASSAPAFRPNEVDAERGVVIEEARSGEADPGVFVWRRLMEVAFRGRPCGRPIVGTPESVSRITADDLREHHEAYHRADNLVQVIAGDVDPAVAIEFARGLLESLPDGGHRPRPAPLEPSRPGIRALTYPGSVEQPYVAVAFGGPHALHPDVPALDALCGLLGVGRSSRLSRALQSGDGVVSDIGSGLVTYRDAGLIVVRAVASTDDVDRILEGIFRETELIRREQPGGAEMEKNLRRLEAAYVLEHETPDSIARTLGFFETLGDYTWAEEYVDLLAQVGTEDIVRVARTYLDPEAATAICYVPGRPESPPVDRAARTRELAALAARPHRSSISDRPGPWSPPRVFTRPDVLRESPAAGCERLGLPNGGTLVACRSSALPLVSLTVGFRGGFTEEPPSMGGLTYLAERMASEGTRTRTADEIAESVEGLGSALAAAVERDGFGLGLTVVSRHVEEAVGILGDILVNASFPEERLPFAVGQVVSEIKEIEDHPLRRAIVALLPLAFPGLPHGRPLRGTVDSIGQLGVRDLAEWHGSRCAGDRLTACVVGDVQPSRASELLASVLKDLPSSSGEVSEPCYAAARPSGSTVMDLPGSAQSVVAVALKGPAGGTRDAVVARVLMRALSMMGGRLWRSLRERPPHAYHVGGTLLAYRSAGATVAYATSAPGQERAVVDGLIEEFERLVERGLEADELERTTRHLAGTLDISLMRAAARSASYAMAEVMGAGYEYIEGMSKVVRRVTNDDIVRVAGALMDPGGGFAEVILRGGSAADSK